MRSMWKGSISFGLVTIPVKLYAATESKDVRFNLLHRECQSPVQYRKWCSTCDKEIAATEIIKGYEYERGRYVTVSEEEFDAIAVAAAHTLDIVGFVDLVQIDPVYYDKTYYLEPGEGGAKAYALLRKAMEESGRIAIARVVIRTKESLAAIRVFSNGVLALETMHFPDEIRSPAGLRAIAEPEIRPQEMEMAMNLIMSLSGDFVPEQFQNEYRQQLLELIEAKVTGEDVIQAPQRPEQGKVVDLMEALRASVRAAEAARVSADGIGTTPESLPAAPAAMAASGIPAAGGVASPSFAPVPPHPQQVPTIAPGPGFNATRSSVSAPLPRGIPVPTLAPAPIGSAPGRAPE